jgi:phosphoglycerol transferase MdoB-like AlkP superfamily enzyme
VKFNSPYISQIKDLLKKILVLLALYSFSRILFYVFNTSYFSDASLGQLFKIFLFGTRFDYSAIIQFNLLFIVLYLLPFSFTTNRIYRRILFIAFWVINGFLLLGNFIDIEYFKYTSKRTTADIFKYAVISSDVRDLIPQFLHDFWYIPLLWIVSVWAGIKLTRNKASDNINFKLVNLIVMILLSAVLFMTARGFAMKPLRIISAARYASSQDIPLLLNTPFTILHTIQERENSQKNYFKDNSYQKEFSPVRQYKAYQKRTDNVVIIILESFSHEFIGTLNGGKTYTPFLDSLMKQSLYFKNGFANCRKSIEAIPAILAGLPSLTDNSYISSRYAGNRLKALPFILQEHGYQTSFFHGGKNGTMGFDEFSKISGIKEYYGMNQYKGPEAFDGNWGIFDFEFLQFTANKLTTFKQPFFSAIFTLSSHHPYLVPERFNSVIPGNEEPQLRAIRYTDISLRNFFSVAKKQPWYKNTLFVLVADHTAKIIDNKYNNPVGTFRIPVIFYHPGLDSLRGEREDIVQQTDIMPSVLHFLGIEDPYLAYGSSIFDSNRDAYGVSYLSNIYYYFKNRYILSFDGEKTISLCNYYSDKALKYNIKDSNDSTTIMDHKLKAILQDYMTRLEKNEMFVNKR